MEGIFKAYAKQGKIQYSSPDDLFKYACENEGALVVSIKPEAKISEKMQMYAYLFGPVMDCAVRGFTAAGYELMDKVKARFLLEAELAKAEAYNPKTGKTTIYTESISSMDKKRLLKFLQDVLFFLESELGQRVPDAEQWKLRKLTGRSFDRI